MSLKKGEQLMLTNISCDSLVSKEHAYRKINEVMDLRGLEEEFEKLYSVNGQPGIPVEKGLRAIIVQFMEDFSDRGMQRALAENLAVKWFCGFELTDKTPDHSYFEKLRKRLGTENIAKVFNTMVEQLKRRDICGNVFTFIDSAGIVTKTALWAERDKAIKDGLDKLNNTNVKDYSADKDARFGCKGKNKFWFGYKRHHSVDMKSGIIKKVAVTAANVADGEALKHVCPKDGSMVFADKAFCGKTSRNTIKAKGCYDGGVILKNNMKDKNKDKDRWATKVRMPYEGIFSKCQTRARYRGTAKVQFQAFMEAIVHNIKTAAKILELTSSRGIGLSTC
jgi:IS5 family transposase